MTNEQKLVDEFHRKYNAVRNEHPVELGSFQLLLRSRLIVEEAAEFVSAASKGDVVEMVDALCDLLFVTYGAGVAMGVDLEPCFAEVARSNLTKDGGGSDTGGKIVKGPHYQPPNLVPILKQQGMME